MLCDRNQVCVTLLVEVVHGFNLAHSVEPGFLVLGITAAVDGVRRLGNVAVCATNGNVDQEVELNLYVNSKGTCMY